tara:strand:- start:134 stop:1087 length:954 start_codon:yes stop_codon:yes gene_type:complete
MKYVYLDQNILDQMVKNDPNRIKKTIETSNFQVLYSIETLKEIHRCKHTNKMEYLNLLDELNAQLMTHINSGNDRQAWVREDGKSAKNAYEFENQNGTFDEDINFPIFIQKRLLGSLKREDEAELIPKLINDFEELIDDSTERDKTIEKFRGYLNSICERIHSEEESRLKNRSDINSLIALFKSEVSQSKLRDFKRPVIEEILKHFNKLQDNRDDENYIDLELVLGIFEQNNKSDYWPMLMSAYTTLGNLGYWGEKQLHKDNKFEAAQSDSYHLIWASYCDICFSGDERFVYKSRAIYDYFDIKTVVIYCNPQLVGR